MNRPQRLSFLEGRAKVAVQRADGTVRLFTPEEVRGKAYNAGASLTEQRELHEIMAAEVPLVYVTLFKSILENEAFPGLYSFSPVWQPSVMLSVSEREDVPTSLSGADETQRALVQSARTAGCSIADKGEAFNLPIVCGNFLDDQPYNWFDANEHLRRHLPTSNDLGCVAVLTEAEMSAAGTDSFRTVLSSDNSKPNVERLSYHKERTSLITRKVLREVDETVISND
jgi:hypothetical protein